MTTAPILLLVEPSSFVRSYLYEWLENVLSHYRILVAENSDDALRLAAQEQPTHILMETYLPDAPGFEVLQQIRQTLPAARIIATHWYESRSYLQKVHDAGADRFILKERLHSELLPLLKDLEVV
jgi:DNA-binding NarL/FixJ family response regulator